MHIVSLDVESVLRDGVPDWERIGFEVCCARCGYNLRMLSAPRCPECGLEFAWGEALRQADSESDFLFEHQWRRRPVRSFVVTVWRSFRPWKFWRSVSIHQRIAAGPPIFLIACSVGLAVGILQLIGHGTTWLLIAAGGSFGATLWGQSPRTARVLWALMGLVESRGRVLSFATRFGVEMAVMLAAMVGLILVLRQTLAGCRVRFVQVLRVVAYAAIPVALLETLLRLAALCAPRMMTRPVLNDDYLLLNTALFAAIVAAATAIPAIYLMAGIREYLRLPHAAGIAAAAALVGVMCRGVVYFNL